MDPAAIEELGRGAFVTYIRPLTRERLLKIPALGFDTEYTSKGQELISLQLSDGRRDLFIPARKLTVDRLAKHSRELISPEDSEVLLMAYFSIAELQHLPVIEQAVELRSFGASIDVSFYSRRYGLLVRVFDLARFFDRQPLSKVAASYGLAKLDTVDRSRVTHASIRSRRFREYAARDARLCFDIAARLRKGFAPDGVDPLFEGSPASSAAAAFRRKLSRPLHPPAARARMMGMLACWGGRAEALARGSFKGVREFDLVSAYPTSAVSLGSFPCRGDWKPIRSVKAARGAIGGVLRARFKFPSDCSYPCLPVWTKRCQVYPLAGDTYCTLDEARLAEELGARVSVVEGFGYWQGETVLADYLETLSTERAATKDPVRRIALKLLANSLIGKLAQRVVAPDLEALIKLARQKGLGTERLVGLTREECEALGVPIKVRLGSLFFPEWNSLITGRVRAIMGRAISERGAIYASTDAIWTQAKEAPSPYLGSRWEFKRKGSATVARTRLGRLGEHVAHHSIWRKEAGITILERVALDIDTPLSYHLTRPRKLKEALKGGNHFGEWIQEEREASGRWDYKRDLAPGGRSSSPWGSASEYLAAAKEADAAARAASKSAARGGRNGRADRKGVECSR